MKIFLTACLTVSIPVLALAQIAPLPDATAKPPPFQPVVPAEHTGLGRVGVRLAFDKVTGLPYIAGLTRGGPAVDYGFRVGDIILKIDKNLTSTLTPEECSIALHGQPGTGVELTVMRDDDPNLIVRSIERRILLADQEELINPPMSSVAKAQ